MSITQAHAETAIAAACRAANEIGVPMNIAGFDDAANLKAFARMDGALLGSLDIALGKARTAALFGFNTEAIGEFCKPGGTSPGLENTNGGLVVFARRHSGPRGGRWGDWRHWRGGRRGRAGL